MKQFETETVFPIWIHGIFCLLRFYCGTGEQNSASKATNDKNQKSKILSTIASFLNSCFTGGEILHMVILMLGARLTTGSSMRILCPHWETDWRESRWLKCKKKKETGLTPAGNSCCRVGRHSGDAYVPETSPVWVVWLLLHLMNRLSESLLRIPFLSASGERYLSLFLTATLSMIRF